MADAPASLRQADANIYKTAMRAEQLQTVKPIVAYWCDYWVLKQILAKGLHNTNPEILEYSTHLMDKMEQTKAAHGEDDAIRDDVAGQAHIELFAQETLDRAQRVVKANKVTATTANTFDAAATFFGLVNIWGTPDAETLQKIKYAKWNAARILKAIKEGNDPNESNPNPQDLPSQEAPPEQEQGHDQVPEQGERSLPINGEAVPSPGAELPPSPPVGRPRPVTIQDEPDEPPLVPPGGLTARRDSAGVSLPHSPASSATSHAHLAAGGPSLPPPAASPLSFPSPTAPPAVATPSPPADTFYQHPPPSGPPPPTMGMGMGMDMGGYPPGPSAPPPPASAASPVAGFPPAYTSRIAPQPSAPAPAPYVPTGAVDDLSMANAQKHAKWAISALNFEDVSTAVRELRKALEFLGAA